MPQFIKWFLCVLIGCFWINLAHAADSPAATVVQPAASEATAAKAAPAIEISHPSYNFGTVQEGKPIAHDFTVKNTGRGILRIKQVQPG